MHFGSIWELATSLAWAVHAVLFIIFSCKSSIHLIVVINNSDQELLVSQICLPTFSSWFYFDFDWVKYHSATALHSKQKI